MDNGGARRIIPIIMILVVIAIAIAAVVSIGQSIFGGQKTEEVNQGKLSLLNTSTDRSVRVSVRGPIVADEKYYSFNITIRPNGRTLTTYNGYLNRQIESRDLTNNIPAYEQFVYALNRAQMMDAPELTGDANDTRGICATGRVIRFDTLRGTTVVKSLWTSTCKNTSGSLKTDYITLENLFKAQIPDSIVPLSKIHIE
jgi:hypothetical protein